MDSGCSTSSITYAFGSPLVSNISKSDALKCALLENVSRCSSDWTAQAVLALPQQHFWRAVKKSGTRVDRNAPPCGAALWHSKRRRWTQSRRWRPAKGCSLPVRAAAAVLALLQILRRSLLVRYLNLVNTLACFTSGSRVVCVVSTVKLRNQQAVYNIVDRVMSNVPQFAIHSRGSIRGHGVDDKVVIGTTTASWCLFFLIQY